MKRPSRHVLSRVALAIAVLSAASLTLLGPAQAASTVTEALLSNTGQTQHADGGVTMGPTNSDPEFVAQAFTTGTDANGYELSSIGVEFGDIETPPGTTRRLALKVSVHAEVSGNVPGARHCTGNLVSPVPIVENAVNVFTVDPDNPCTLAANETYYLRIRVDSRFDGSVQRSNSTIVWDFTGSTTLDDGAAAGWSIAGGFLHGATSSSWTSVSGKTLQVEINTEVPTAGLIIDSTELDIEEGDSASYTVKLAAAPEGDVEVTIGGHDNTDATLSGTGLTGSVLTFTTSNWNTLQTVTVTAEEDGDNDNEAAIALTHTATSTDDTDYNNLTGSSVTVSITDNDEAGLIIEPTELAIEEGEVAVLDGNTYLVPAGYTYTVKLATEPEADVDVEVTGHADTSAVLTGVTNDTLTFTPSNWDMAQTVVVTASEDDDDDETVTLSHEASSTDDDYSGLTSSDVTVTVAITDNDEAGLIFSLDPADPLDPRELTVGEEDVASYTVRLASRPQERVTVNFAGLTGSDVSLTGDVQSNLLHFDPAEWNTDKTVTVVAGPDDDGRDDTVALLHSTSTVDDAYGDVVDVEVEVTITDDDEAGLIFSLDPLELFVTEEVPASYTVRLATKPQATIFVFVEPAPTTDLTMSGDVVGSALSFEPDEWDTPQTVTFEVDHDDDGRDGSFHLVNSPLSDGNGDSDYDNLAARSIAVTVDDDDSPAVIVDPTGITAVETSSADYTVRLATEPSDEVTVTISGHSAPEASLSGSDVSNDALTFTTDNWDMPQTVTVNAADDADTLNESVTLLHTATSTDDTDYANLSADPTGDPATVTVTITDDDRPNVAINLPAIDVNENGSATYTVQLVTQPSADVTVTVTVPPNSGASLPGDALTRDLTFTSGNWNTPQTVIVEGEDDFDARDNDPFDISHTSSGADYDNLAIGPVTVTVIDDDEAGLLIDPTAIDVEEEGSASYTVTLATEPSANVTVDIDGHLGTDASLSGSDVSNDQLTFTTGNWDTPQTVTVSAADDGDADDEAPVNLTHTASSTVDTQYNLTGDPVRVTITDNDDVGIVGSDTAVVLVSTDSFELVEGDSGEYTITLGTQPTEDVTVSIIGNAGSDVRVTGNTLSNDVKLTFTAANWSTAQTVTVTADQDDDAIDESDVTLTHVAESMDSAYNSISVDSITVVVDDDDTASVTVSVPELSVTEGGSSTYEVSLSSQPTAEVTVTVAGHAGSDLTLSGNTLTFTVLDWTAAQTVTVTAAEDDDAGTDTPVDLTHTAVSDDPDYGGVSVGSVRVTVTENDTAEITVSHRRLTVDEIDIGTYTVVLSHPPTSEVTIEIAGDGDVTTNPTQLVFDALNWNTAQTVMVIAGNDDDANKDPVLIAHAVVEGSADEYFQLADARVLVIVTDTDTAGLSVSPAAIGILEEGTGTYTVALTSEPSADVTVDITAGGTVTVTVEPASLTFTATTWDKPSTVTVSAADDTAGGTATLTHTTNDDAPEYKGVTADVAVNVTDNDAAGVVLSPRSLTVTEGETGAYTVSLAQAPTADVTIEVTAGAGVTVNDGAPASVTFTPSNWNRPRKVTVAADEDDDKDGGSATISHSIAAGSAAEYIGVAVDNVVVAIVDNDVPGLRISSQALAIANGRTTTYMVSLNSAPGPDATLNSSPPLFQTPEVKTDLGPRPATDVDVKIYAAGDLSVEPTVLRFTASNWEVPQTVRVTATTVRVTATGAAAAAIPKFTIVHEVTGPDDYADIANEGLDLTVTPGRSSSGSGSSGGGGGGGSSGGGGGGGGGDLDVGVATFVVANGWSPSDVGVASVLAARTTGAVVVYTAGDALSEATRELMREASPAEVVIVGGTAAVSRDVRTQIRAASSESGIARVSGEDRSDTAAATARRILGAPSTAGRVTVIVANGWSPPDIGAAAALAARSGRSAVLYTERDSLPEASASLLRDYNVTRVILIGGTAAISTEVYDQIAAAASDASVSRLTGADRVDTAAQAARRVLGNPAAAPDGVTLVIANGWSAPDVGVAAALAAATENSAVAYTSQGTLPEATAALITDYRPSQVIIVGGSAAVTNDVRAAITETAPGSASVRRITGSTRIETAVRAARRILANL
ncbi:cell wall-binding repeat-containing protein [Candidatus Poriferisodalis sp.]|uniref:cell wall-binding repeat-containing protein n=1 Tax=Candidatus Poriferisodalis sp. TaxID=3101277 RepID=UPI003B51E1D6